MPGITVGVDGSDNSHRALEWAMKEAALRHAPLTVLAVHEVAANQWTANPVIYPEDAPMTEQARNWAEEAVSKVAGQLGDAQPLSVTVNAKSGFSAKELIDCVAGQRPARGGLARRRRIRQAGNRRSQQQGRAPLGLPCRRGAVGQVGPIRGA